MVLLAIFRSSIIKKSDPEKAFADENAPFFFLYINVLVLLKGFSPNAH